MAMRVIVLLIMWLASQLAGLVLNDCYKYIKEKYHAQATG